MKRANHRPLLRFSPLIVLALAVLAAGLFAGCANLSVAHLESRPFPAGTSTSLSMKFMRFEFMGRVTGGAYRLRGRAIPVTTDLPSWADRLDSLDLTVYLRDAAGNVMATTDRHYKGMPLAEGAAIPFECSLTPTRDVPEGYFVSFGYKAVFGTAQAQAVRGAGASPPSGAEFFVGEGAVLKQ